LNGNTWKLPKYAPTGYKPGTLTRELLPYKLTAGVPDSPYAMPGSLDVGQLTTVATKQVTILLLEEQGV